MADTLLSEIVVQAFREGNFVALGEDTPAEELQEAVPRLRNLISAVMGIELGEHYRDWYVPHAYNPEAPLRYPLTPTGTGGTSALPWQYPPANSRLLVKVDEARTLYFPATPNDGARMAYVDLGSTGDVTLDGNGRLIEGATSISSDIGGAPAVSLSGRQWLYRSDKADWILLVNELKASDTVPLPPEFDDLWVTGLVMRMAPRFQIEIQPSIGERYADMLGRLRKRYKQSERQPTTQELRQHMREF